MSEVASLVHTIKHQQVLTTNFCFCFFGFRDNDDEDDENYDDDEEEAALFTIWPLLLASALIFYDECRAANPGHENDDERAS